MDFKTNFLHWYLEEIIYMEQPEGFIDDMSNVCLLNKYIWIEENPKAMVSSIWWNPSKE